MEIIKKICKSYAEVVFPPTCVCCGSSTKSDENSICSLCRLERFESAGAAEKNILPQSVLYVHNMWFFDKGGYLQDLLHKLKYHFMRGVGVELGSLLGKDFLQLQPGKELKRMDQIDPVIIPVPLYFKKRRKRGYNQARALAEGVRRSTGWAIIKKGTVKRIRKTQTQTGLTLEERSRNLKNAFQVTDSNSFRNRQCIIIDDVFTTGATTFELAKTLYKVNKKPSIILTVARA
ncbi:MAG: ComF family protein [Balneolaceae bacterium]|nr:ComF family protein [Balneolaceae bacterium]